MVMVRFLINRNKLTNTNISMSEGGTLNFLQVPQTNFTKSKNRLSTVNLLLSNWQKFCYPVALLVKINTNSGVEHLCTETITFDRLVTTNILSHIHE